MTRATLPGPVATPPAQPPSMPAGFSGAKVRAGRANFRQAYDLAIMGGLGALFGLYLYVEMVTARSVYVRDAWAGLLIGGSLGLVLERVWTVARRRLAEDGAGDHLGGSGGGPGRRGRDWWPARW